MAITIVAASAVLALSARIQVPLLPVRVSLQSLVVLCLGAGLGARWGTAAVALYVIEGAMGAPVFQGGAGLAYLLGPTGGYVLGFLMAVFLVGTASDRGALRRPLGAFSWLAIGTATIYGPGVAWLAVHIGPTAAVRAGLLVFLPSELLKLPTAWAAALLIHSTRPTLPAKNPPL